MVRDDRRDHCGKLCKSIRDAAAGPKHCCDAMQAEIKPDDLVLIEQIADQE